MGVGSLKSPSLVILLSQIKQTGLNEHPDVGPHFEENTSRVRGGSLHSETNDTQRIRESNKFNYT